ncbi:MAG TPA: serine hydrolase domain-containing protein [Rubrivivax sp.]|nr:serine hydrolase domain-containing protein [Rubrivivax sp.]
MAPLRLCLGLLALAAALAGCANRQADDPLAARVDAVLAPLVQRHEFSGAVVLARRGRVVYERGFGLANRAAGTAFTPDTPTDGASLAKTFTAAAVALLAAEGRIALDAPVASYLPAYPHRATSVRQLLSHSNGLPPQYESFDRFLGPDELRTTQRLLTLVARHFPAPAFEPGTRFEYSSLGFDAAALLVEHVSGQAYGRFLRERFFKPLEMDASFVRPARLAEWPGVRTMGYRWRQGHWAAVDVSDLEGFVGGSNLYFSARDLSRWASAHAEARALPQAIERAGRQRPRLGGAASAINLLSWYCDEPADSGTRCWYSGDLNAFYSLVMWDRRSGESLVYVSNSALPAWRRPELAQDLGDALAGRPQRPRMLATLQRFDKASRQSIAGRYTSPLLGTVMVAADLRLCIDGEPDYAVFQVSSEVFYVPGRDLWLAFSGDTRAAVMHVRSVLDDHTAIRLADDPDTPRAGVARCAAAQAA